MVEESEDKREEERDGEYCTMYTVCPVVTLFMQEIANHKNIGAVPELSNHPETWPDLTSLTLSS